MLIRDGRRRRPKNWGGSHSMGLGTRQLIDDMTLHGRLWRSRIEVDDIGYVSFYVDCSLCYVCNGLV